MAIKVNGVELEMGDFLSQLGVVNKAFCDGVQIWPPAGGEGFFNGNSVIKRISATAVLTSVTPVVGIGSQDYHSGGGVGGIAMVAAFNGNGSLSYRLSRFSRNNVLLSSELIGEWNYCFFSGGARSGVNVMIHGGQDNSGLHHGVFTKDGVVVRTLSTLSAMRRGCCGSDNLLTTNAFFYGGGVVITTDGTDGDVRDKLDIINPDSVIVATQRTVGINGGGNESNGAAIGSVSIFYGGTRKVEGGSSSTNAVLRLNILGNQVSNYTFLGHARHFLNGARCDDVTVWHGGVDDNSSRTSLTTLINEDGTQRGVEVSLGITMSYGCSATMS